jgi:hypothetical protein
MKARILILTIFLFISCAKKPPVDSAANERIREKNKEVAAKNAVTEITRLAQKLEQNGRDMQSYREASGAESDRQCNLILEERRKDLIDLETRINKLPENYKSKWTPILNELNECVSCAKKGLGDCKRARASINQAIKELYP